MLLLLLLLLLRQLLLTSPVIVARCHRRCSKHFPSPLLRTHHSGHAATATAAAAAAAVATHLSCHGGQVPQALLKVHAALQQRPPVARDDGRELLQHCLCLLLTVQLQEEVAGTAARAAPGA
jgi:hypothetical protein